MKARVILHRAAALSLGILGAVALAEVILRVLQLAPTTGVATVTAEQFERLPGIFAPNQDLVDRRKPQLPYRVEIDSLGYRGAEFPRAKEPHEVRLLIAGDSFVYGDFVNDDETLPALLERDLRSRCNNVRVINAGLGGATIADEAMMIRRSAVLAPDLVVLVFFENDVTDLAETPLWTRLAAHRRAKSRFPASLVYPILRRTALWQLALAVEAGLQARGSLALAGEGLSPQENSAIPRLREIYHQALIALRDTLRVHHVPFVFVLFPEYSSIPGRGVPEQLGWAEETARAAGIRTYDLLYPLRASRLLTTQLYLVPRDGHASPQGYAVAARGLSDSLLSSSPLAAKCRGE
jgi:hypothetical protein